MATKCCIPVMFIRLSAPDSIGKTFVAQLLRGGELREVRISVGERAQWSGMKCRSRHSAKWRSACVDPQFSFTAAPDGSRRGSGSGSGVICSDSGLIVTNAHVIRGSHQCVQLWDGREFAGQVTERDHSRDLAALRIPAQGLPPVSIADSSRIRAGELALAIGNPLGFVGALSTGVVHAVGPVRGLGPLHVGAGECPAGCWKFRRTACQLPPATLSVSIPW